MAEISTGKGLKGIIFDIQRYSIHDGPGIRTTVFLKGCPLSCFWCQNPESQALEPVILFDRSRCTSCGQCITACPSGANSLTDEGIKIARGKCTGCGKCLEVCPNEARKLAGRYVTVAEVMEEVLRDRKFYERSGGGVTLSGGEPTLQSEFALHILKKCQEAGLHTAMETCGYVPWQTLEKLLEFTDLVLYDIKCLDTKKHNKATGKPNDLIIANAKKIARSKEMRVRVPLIPGFNDSEEEVSELVRFVKKELGPLKIDLLSYNKLGQDKYGRLERVGVRLEPQSEDYIKKLEALAVSE